MMVYGNCVECGATPCDDQTDLCEECAALALEECPEDEGEFDEQYQPWDMAPDDEERLLDYFAG